MDNESKISWRQQRIWKLQKKKNFFVRWNENYLLDWEGKIII